MRPIVRCTALAALMVMFASNGVDAAPVILYDSSVASLPNIQGKLFFGGSFGGTQVLSPPDGTVFDSASTTAGKAPDESQIGYTNIIGLDLDRAAGFRLDFDVRIDSESHATPDRAGFSVIAISSDLNGIELGFWDNEVWAQNAGFTHGEGTPASPQPFDTTAAIISYSLLVQGSAYTLSADGLEILTGSLRDYSATGWIYSIENSLFFGDDTGSARAVVTLGDISVDTALVPLPPAIFLMIPALVGLLRLRRG